MQETPDDFCGQSCRKIFPGPRGPGRVIILALLLFGLILAPAWSQPPSNPPAATPVEQTFHLLVSRQKVKAGDTVMFEVQPGAISPYVEYRFNFGDGDWTGWAKEPKREYQYKSAGTYSAQAEVQITLRARVQTKTMAPEKIDVADVRPLTPTPTRTKARERVTPSPQGEKTTGKTTTNVFPWLWFLAGGLLVAVVLWRVWPNNAVVLPPLTFEAHWDNTPQTTGQKKIPINYELRFDPNFSSGIHKLEPLGPDLVKAIKEVP
jgi:PKD domain